MSAQKAASWGYAEDFVAESEIAEKARHRGEELGLYADRNGGEGPPCG